MTFVHNGNCCLYLCPLIWVRLCALPWIHDSGRFRSRSGVKVQESYRFCEYRSNYRWSIGRLALVPMSPVPVFFIEQSYHYSERHCNAIPLHLSHLWFASHNDVVVAPNRLELRNQSLFDSCSYYRHVVSVCRLDKMPLIFFLILCSWSIYIFTVLCRLILQNGHRGFWQQSDVYECHRSNVLLIKPKGLLQDMATKAKASVVTPA